MFAMTISSEINKSGPYVGNGVVTQFDFDFKIDEAAHLHVIRTSVSGVEAVLTENEYQVLLDADRTGSVTLSDPLPTGEKITLLLNPPFNQLVDLPNQGAWNPEVLESALDKLTSCLLKLREEVSRAVKIKASSDLADLDDLLADIERLADVASEVKSLVGVKADIITCAANITAILAADDEAVNAASSAQTASNLRDEVATMKQLVETAKDQVIAARDAAQAAQPINATTKGRELVAKDTAAEMRTVLGAMAVDEVPSGVPVGAMIDWPVDAVPAFWARADGSAFSRSTYSDLHDALAPEFTVTITNGSAVMTGIGSAQGFRAGMAIEGAGIPVGTTIQSVDGANQITLSANATANGTKCRVYRYGNGDGSTTFNLPNFAGRVSRTWDPSGAINPDEAALGVSQEDALQGHWHKKYSIAYNQASQGGSVYGAEHPSMNDTPGPDSAVRDAVTDGTNGTPRIASETRGKSLIVNKIIKVSGGVDATGVLAAAGALADIANALTKAEAADEKIGSVAILEYQQPSGTPGGNATAGAWTTSPINTEVSDPENFVSLSSNEFTLDRDCVCDWHQVFFATSYTKTRIYNVTDAVAVNDGLAAYLVTNNASANAVPGAALLTGGKTYRLEYYVAYNPGTGALGFAASQGTEKYAVVRLRGL